MDIAALKAASRLVSEGVKKTPLPNLPAVCKNAVYQQVKGNRRRAPSVRIQPRHLSFPKITKADKIKVGRAFKKAFKAHPSPTHKTFHSLLAHLWRIVRTRQKNPRYVVAKYLQKVMPAKALTVFIAHLNRSLRGAKKPARRHPSRYSTSKADQRVYAAGLLVQYINHVSRQPQAIKGWQVKRIGKALRKTMWRYHKTLGHKAMVPLSCAMRASYVSYQRAQKSQRKQLLQKWYNNWLPRGSASLKYFVKALNRTMPRKLKPTQMYPVSKGYRQGYAKWLLIQYVLNAKLKAPPAPLVTLSKRQRKLYLKHAVFPAVWKATTKMVRDHVEARRHLIWSKYTSLNKLPPDLATKLFRYTSNLLKRREFKKTRQHIADWEAQYCPSGREAILGAVYKEAVWNADAIRDAKRRKLRKKPANLKNVALSPQQKGIVLSAILKAVNAYLRKIGKKTRFKSPTHLKQYLRKEGWIWSRLGRLDSILTPVLVKLLLGKKLGVLPQQLSKLRRGTPKMLFNSAVFDTKIGNITVAFLKLPVITKPTPQPAVALKPLRLSGMAHVSARAKLLRAWQANRMVHSNLPNYRNSKKLASYLKKHGSKLKKDEKKFLILAFKNALNAGYLSSIKPKLKAPTKQAEFAERVYLAVLERAEGASKPVVARPTPRPRPRPANKQIALQKGLVASVRKVYGSSTSETAAKTVLKTQKWSTLKSLGIVGLIQKEFADLGHKRAARSSYLARLLVKKTLRNWKSSSDTTHTPTTPARPVARPVPRTSDKQGARQNLLVAAVRATYGASTSVSAAKTVLKTQKWSVLKRLGIAPYIMKGFAKLGYRRASKSHYFARRLVKKTLTNWGASSSSTSHVTPARPASSSVTPAERKAYVRGALLKVLKTKGLASSPGEATAFAKGQKWRVLVALKLHKPFIQALNNDFRLGKWRPNKSRSQTRAARKLYQSLKR